jgi:hypothetical protein
LPFIEAKSNPAPFAKPANRTARYPLMFVCGPGQFRCDILTMGDETPQTLLVGQGGKVTKSMVRRAYMGLQRQDVQNFFHIALHVISTEQPIFRNQ